MAVLPSGVAGWLTVQHGVLGSPPAINPDGRRGEDFVDLLADSLLFDLHVLMRRHARFLVYFLLATAELSECSSCSTNPFLVDSLS